MKEKSNSIKTWLAITEELAQPLYLLKDGAVIASNRTARSLASEPPAGKGQSSATPFGEQIALASPTNDQELQRAQQALEFLVDERTEQLRSSLDKLQIELIERTRAQEALHIAHEELKEKQLQLMHTSKLAALGQMAAGITHEINNPLAYVSSNLDVLVPYVASFRKLIGQYRALLSKVEVMGTGPLREGAKEVREAEKQENISYLLKDIDQLINESREGARRVTDIIRGLKGYSRMEQRELRESDLHEGIESTLKILSQELQNHHCHVVKEFGKLPPIRCIPGQINQVFLNLLVNAAHASSASGRITVSTEMGDERVIIRISDEGKGIPQNELDHIFDPFFTTKGEEGSGIGLSISKKIVQEHRGTLSVESREGEGTTFTLELPLDPEPEELEVVS